MTLRLAIVGAGVMGARFGSTAQAIPGVEVTAIVDQLAARSEGLATQLGARAYSSISDLAGEADAVYIGVPHDQHLSACLEAAAAGLHILIDKPLCNTLDEARQIVDATSAAGVRVMVGFSYRYRAEWVRAAELVAAGAIGRPRLVIDTLIEAAEATPAWYWDAAAGGGVLQLQSHHCFDRLAWVLGDRFATVACQVSGLPDSAEDTAVINAATDAGVLVSIDIGYGREYAATPRPSTVFQGERGQIVINHRRTIILETSVGVQELDCSDDDWLLTELTAFVALCESGVAAPGTAEGIAALESALAAAASSRAGGAVQTVASST